MGAFVSARDGPAFITPWTYIHFLVGIVAYTMYKELLPGMSVLLAAALWMVFHGLYELRDVLYKRGSTLNSTGDQIFAMLGFYAGHLIGFKGMNLATSLVLAISHAVFVRAGFG